MINLEYLVSHGRAGDFGRFRPVQPLSCRRGDRVVVRSGHGLELGVVMCPASPGHSQFLSRTALGELLRIAGAEDERLAERCRERGQALFEHGRRLAKELDLALEIVDVEVLFDGQQAIVYHLRGQECDQRPLVSALSKAHDLLIIMENLALPTTVEHEEKGCGLPGCGQAEGGGCTSCGSGGGCSTCGKGLKKDEVAAFLSGLRQPAPELARTPLL